MTQWKDLRKKVFERDGGRCTSCGAEADSVHHVIPRGKGGSDALENLVSVCRGCHRGLEPKRYEGVAWTTIRVSKQTCDVLSNLGGKEDTFEDILRRVLKI